jgi:DNA-binding NarL/FixJ family response regulator
MSTAKKRVIIVDDHQLVNDGLKDIISEVKGVEVYMT